MIAQIARAALEAAVLFAFFGSIYYSMPVLAAVLSPIAGS